MSKVFKVLLAPRVSRVSKALLVKLARKVPLALQELTAKTESQERSVLQAPQVKMAQTVLLDLQVLLGRQALRERMGKTGRKVPLALLVHKEKRATKATRVFLANSAPLVPQDRMEQTGRSVLLDLLA